MSEHDDLPFIEGDLEKQIMQLERGQPVLMGGRADIDYLRKKMDAAGIYPQTHPLRDRLEKVDPSLSTYAARVGRGEEKPIHFPTRGERILDCIYAIAPSLKGVLDETLAGEVTVVCDSFTMKDSLLRSPFVAIFPEQVPGDLLLENGFEAYVLEKNQALALFTDMGRLRCAAQLPGDRHLDKEILSFIGRQAGNHGDMYFIGPPTDHAEMVDMVLSPVMVGIASSLFGRPVRRRRDNLIGTLEEGSTAYRKGMDVLVNPPQETK